MDALKANVVKSHGTLLSLTWKSFSLTTYLASQGLYWFGCSYSLDYFISRNLFLLTLTLEQTKLGLSLSYSTLSYRNEVIFFMENSLPWPSLTTLQKKRKKFKNQKVIHCWIKWPSLKLVIILGISVVLMHSGAALSKMITIQLLPFLWHWQGCGWDYEKCVRTHRFTAAWRCATFGSLACCLHLNPQEMENGLQFLKLMLRSDSLEMQRFTSQGSHCERFCRF